MSDCGRGVDPRRKVGNWENFIANVQHAVAVSLTLPSTRSALAMFTISYPSLKKTMHFYVRRLANAICSSICFQNFQFIKLFLINT